MSVPPSNPTLYCLQPLHHPTYAAVEPLAAHASLLFVIEPAMVIAC